jgi:hypothetical protein
MNELNMFTDDDFDKDFDKDEIFVGHEINKDLVNTDFLSKKNQKVYYFRNIRVRLFGNVPKSYIKRVLTILDYYFDDFTYDGIIEKESLCDDHPILNYLKSNNINSFRYSYIRISGSSNIFASPLSATEDVQYLPVPIISLTLLSSGNVGRYARSKICVFTSLTCSLFNPFNCNFVTAISFASFAALLPLSSRILV